MITEIKLLENEYFWGGMVGDGIFMPMRINNISRDLSNEHRSNQTAPLLISNLGRFIWNDEAFKYTFCDKLLTIESNNMINIDNTCDNLADAYKKVCELHFKPSGKIPHKQLFLTPQYNLWIEMMYEPTQEKVLQYANNIIKYDFPVGVLTIDDCWQEDYGVWKFNSKKFPNPKEMIGKLHNDGFLVMLWVCNYVSADSVVFRYLRDNDMLIKETQDEVAIVKWWNGYSAMLDISNPKTVKWLNEQLDMLVNDYGVDGFKFDAGDITEFRDHYISYGNINGNDYSELWAKIGLRYPLNEYRVCFKMGCQPLAQRLSDKKHSWSDDNGLGSLIPNGLAQGIMGYSYTCPDMIGGGEYSNFLANSNSLDKELIIRYAQCSALFPMMQFSVAPWRILDEKSLEICRKAAKLHTKFGNEMLELAYNSAKTGEPIIRYLEYEYPHMGYLNIKDEFMLGHKILVAPIVEKNAEKRKIVFPPGKWIDINGNIIEGACVKEVKSPIDCLPFFVNIDS